MAYKDPTNNSQVKNIETDIRVRTTNGVPEIIIKLGGWGGVDESRKELSVVGRKGEFDKMIQMMAALGHKQGIVAIRKGKIYDYKGIEFSLVEVPNHSYYFEAEKMVSDEAEKKIAIKEIMKICGELKLETLTQQGFFDYIHELNTKVNEQFDYKNYEENYFAKRFGI